MALRQLICLCFTKHVPNNMQIALKISRKWYFFHPENLCLNFPDRMNKQINYMTDIFIENL